MEQILHNRRSRVLGTLYHLHYCLYRYRHIIDLKRSACILYVSLAAVALALVATYYIFDPNTSIFFPKCPFRMLTNLPCAGCGSQRAIHSLLHGDIRQAAEYNFLLVVFLPVIVILSVSSLFRTKYPKIYLALHHKYVSYTILVIVIVWWALRIVFHWYI